MEMITLWTEEEYTYPAFGFIPTLAVYHENGENPWILVVPGGGYDFVSITEAEVVAKEWLGRDYNAAVLSYTTNGTRSIPLRKQPMEDLARALRYLRKQFGADQKVILCGFSAGAHLCGCVTEHFDDIPDVNPEYAEISARPDAALLCYPVVTTGKLAHRGSFKALLGDAPTEEELDYYSLENHVVKGMPPCFVWQTAQDRSVPVDNSYMLAMELQKKKVPYAFHIFPRGGHGLSLSNKACEMQEFGEPYTMKQIDIILEAEKQGKTEIPDEVRKMFLGNYPVPHDENFRPRPVEADVAVWPELADTWLHKVVL